jgi:hypothetical protein
MVEGVIYAPRVRTTDFFKSAFSKLWLGFGTNSSPQINVIHC